MKQFRAKLSHLRVITPLFWNFGGFETFLANLQSLLPSFVYHQPRTWLGVSKKAEKIEPKPKNCKKNRTEVKSDGFGFVFLKNRNFGFVFGQFYLHTTFMVKLSEVDAKERKLGVNII